MEFINRRHFNDYLKGLHYIGQGSQGICYLRKEDNTVFKIFHDYFDYEDPGYTSEDILKFSYIDNNTFLWPKDVIKVSNTIIGYTMPYKKNKNLYQINPLLVNLNNLEQGAISAEKDIKLLTDEGIKLYDVRYNILYSKGKINIIDTLDYTRRNVTYEENRMPLDQELMLFLIDDYFDTFVQDDNLLKEMYMEYEVRGVDFLRVFKKKLSEYMNKDITKLNEAKALVKKNNKPIYIRENKD